MCDKFVLDNRQECGDFDQTTSVETEDDETVPVQTSKRHIKIKIFSDFTGGCFCNTQ